MTQDDLENLVQVLRAQYDKERHHLEPLLSAEAKLRAALAKLERHDRAARSETEGLSKLRAFGGDVLWATWLGRQRRDLNAQLARVLAEKSERLEQLKTLYARVLAAESMRDDARERSKLRIGRQAEADLLDTLLSIKPSD